MIQNLTVRKIYISEKRLGNVVLQVIPAADECVEKRGKKY